MKNNLKVLIADDSASFGKECKKELESAGFDVVLTGKDGMRVMSLLDSQLSVFQEERRSILFATDCGVTGLMK